jgi:putative tryptophan/tyrosine transport system substrate-binding protein
MRRREVITLLGGAAAWPIAARGQQPDRTRRIGVLMSAQEDDPEGKAQLAGFTRELASLGWTEGRNLRTEIRWGGRRPILLRCEARFPFRNLDQPAAGGIRV